MSTFRDLTVIDGVYEQDYRRKHKYNVDPICIEHGSILYQYAATKNVTIGSKIHEFDFMHDIIFLSEWTTLVITQTRVALKFIFALMHDYWFSQVDSYANIYETFT